MGVARKKTVTTKRCNIYINYKFVHLDSREQILVNKQEHKEELETQWVKMTRRWQKNGRKRKNSKQCRYGRMILPSDRIAKKMFYIFSPKIHFVIGYIIYQVCRHTVQINV